jgi:hypothetical protein
MIPTLHLRCEWCKALFDWTPRWPRIAKQMRRTCSERCANRLTSWERDRGRVEKNKELASDGREMRVMPVRGERRHGSAEPGDGENVASGITDLPPSKAPRQAGNASMPRGAGRAVDYLASLGVDTGSYRRGFR